MGNYGRYQFTDLAAGDYSVGFEDSLSEGKSFVAPGVGDDATDSDVDARGLTGPIRVVAGKEVTNVDAGVADLIFQVRKDFSNIVAYLDCDGQDGDEIFKMKFEFKDNDDGINAVSLSQIQDAVDLAGYGDCEVLAATVKAGKNKGGYGPGEGQFFDADPGDAFDDGTRAKADAQIHVTDDFASIFLFA